MLKRKARRRNNRGSQVTSSNWLFYIVATMASLFGMAAYSAGASLETTMMRMSAVLLVSILLGSILNVAVGISDRSRAVKPNLGRPLRNEDQVAAGAEG